MARTIRFGNLKFEDPGAEYTPEQIRLALTAIYPELANASVQEGSDSNTINFVVKGSTKG